MQNQETLQLLFIINPVSGGKEKQDWEADIREYFKERPNGIAFYILTGENDKISIQHHMDTMKPGMVVAVGGDGTVKMVAEMVKETPIPLGIIPAGSANGMAAELGIPATVSEALDVILNGICKKIDLIRINEEELCIHLSDVGINAMLVKYFEQSEQRGMFSYGKALWKVLWGKQKLRVTIKTDKETLKRKAYMVVLANARKYGTGANINPDGDVADGFFEVVIVRKLNVFEIIKAIFTNRSFHPDKIEVFSTKTMHMDIQRKAHFQVDGEYRGRIAVIEARILPQILNVMVPVEKRS